MLTQSSQALRENSPRKLLEQAQQSPWFYQLTAKINRLQCLQAIFQQAVDWELAQQCHVVELDKNSLTLSVENAAIATKVRYNAPEITKILRQRPEFYGLKSIHCTVRPAYTVPPSTLPPNPIAAESAKAIAAVASGVKDADLKNALLQLARK